MSEKPKKEWDPVHKWYGTPHKLNKPSLFALKKWGVLPSKERKALAVAVCQNLDKDEFFLPELVYLVGQYYQQLDLEAPEDWAHEELAKKVLALVMVKGYLSHE